MNGNVQNTAGSSQRDPPSLVLEVEGLQPFIQKSLNPLHFKHKSGGFTLARPSCSSNFSLEELSSV